MGSHSDYRRRVGPKLHMNNLRTNCGICSPTSSSNANSFYFLIADAMDELAQPRILNDFIPAWFRSFLSSTGK